MIAPGFAFFTPEDRRTGVLRHLWFVLSDPEMEPEQIVIANVSSRPGPDGSDFKVHPGNHRSISHLSWLRCELARVVSLKSLESLLQREQLSQAEPAPPELLRQLRRYLRQSPHTPREVKMLLQKQGLG